jgi:hypothetical protein
MIAGAKWRINKHERTEDQIQVQLPKPGKEQEGNQASIDFMNHLAQSRLKWMGTKPFYCKSTETRSCCQSIHRICSTGANNCSSPCTRDGSEASPSRSWCHVSQVGYRSSG